MILYTLSSALSSNVNDSCCSTFSTSHISYLQLLFSRGRVHDRLHDKKNVPVQCIEVGLLTRLNPAIPPDLIIHIDPETTDIIVLEPPEIKLVRNGLKTKQGNFAEDAEEVG